MQPQISISAAEAPSRKNNLSFSPVGPENVQASFKEIEGYIYGFCQDLKTLSDKAMQLGRVSGLLWSIKKLRKQLSEIENAFLLNAASLHPELSHFFPHIFSLAKDRDFEQLPQSLQDLATRLQNFRNRLDEFHERTDEGATLRLQMNSLIRNIKYRAHCINHYRGRLNTIPIQQYVHQLAYEISLGIHDLHFSLESFIAIGVPAIGYEQKRAAEKFISMSTVATLFSGVTASTLQMSVSTNDKSFGMLLVNILWLCALIFSVGATLNSLLSMAWRQARTGSRAPKMISWWISSSPAAFLALAIVSFSAGLILFAYESEQAIFTAPITIAATGVTFTGLVGVAFGMMYEYWMSHRRDMLDETDIDQLPDGTASIMTRSSVSLVKSEGDWFEEEVEHGNPNPSIVCTAPSTSKAYRLKELARVIGVEHFVLSKLNRRQSSTKGPPSHYVPHPLKPNLISAAKAVVAQQDSRSKSAHLVAGISIAKRYGMVQDMQFSAHTHHLAITCVKEETLAIKSWTAIYNIQSDPMKVFDVWHPGGTLLKSRSVLWSPDGKEVLVRFDHELHIWDYQRGQLRTLGSRHTIRAVLWVDANTILTAEKGQIRKHSRSQRTMETYAMEYLSIRDMAIEPTHNYLVILATVLSHESPPERKQEKRIVVYDMDQKTMVYQLPVLEDVLSIRIARSGLDMIILSKQASFQAWSFDANLNSSNLRVIPILRRLNVIHPNASVDEGYGGPTVFGGADDNFVVSTTQAGKVQIWHRHSRRLELKPGNLLSLGKEGEADLPVIHLITWRPSSPTFAIMRESAEGASVIQLWIAPTPAGSWSRVPALQTRTSSGGSIRNQEPSRPSTPVSPSPVLNKATLSSVSGMVARSYSNTATHAREVQHLQIPGPMVIPQESSATVV